MAKEWEWDPSLYAGSAPYYPVGRLPYLSDVAVALRHELALDGVGRLLDLGCGPGSLALVLTDLFEEVIGVDADEGMVQEAALQARRLGYGNMRWVCMRAESLPDGLGIFRVVTLAQSFHWMNRPQVAAIAFEMLQPGGALVNVGATTHRGSADIGDLPGPTPPTRPDRRARGVVHRSNPPSRAGITPLGYRLRRGYGPRDDWLRRTTATERRRRPSLRPITGRDRGIRLFALLGRSPPIRRTPRCLREGPPDVAPGGVLVRRVLGTDRRNRAFDLDEALVIVVSWSDRRADGC